MAKPGTFLAKLRRQIAASGQSKKGFWFVKEGTKRRVRFLRGSDLEDGITIPWHSKWEGQNSVVDCPCLTPYGKDCPFCGQEEVKLRERFAWSVYDYEQKQVQIFLFYANRNSPITHLAASYEEWGTITDRDLTVARNGTGTDTTYSIIAGTPSKFRFEAKPLSERKVLELTWKAYGQGSLDDYPDEGEELEDEEDIDESEEEEELEDDEDFEESEEEEEELPRKPVKAKAKSVAAPVRKAAMGKRR